MEDVVVILLRDAHELTVVHLGAHHAFVVQFLHGRCDPEAAKIQV